MSAVKDFMDNATKLLAKPALVIGMAASMLMGGTASAQSNAQPGEPETQGAKHGNFFYIGAGREYSQSLYRNGQYLTMGGEATLDESGTFKLAGGYTYYLQDPNTINVGGRYGFPNYFGGYVRGGWQHTHIPSHAHLKIGIQTPPDKRAKLEANMGLDAYFGSQSNIANLASPTLEVKASVDLFKKSAFNITAQAYLEATHFNKGFYNAYVYRDQKERDVAALGVKLIGTYHPPGENNRSNTYRR